MEPRGPGVVPAGFRVVLVDNYYGPALVLRWSRGGPAVAWFSLKEGHTLRVATTGPPQDRHRTTPGRGFCQLQFEQVCTAHLTENRQIP